MGRAWEWYCGFEVSIECGVCYASGPYFDQQHTTGDIEVFDGLNTRNCNEEVNTIQRQTFYQIGERRGVTITP